MTWPAVSTSCCRRIGSVSPGYPLGELDCSSGSSKQPLRGLRCAQKPKSQNLPQLGSKPPMFGSKLSTDFFLLQTSDLFGSQPIFWAPNRVFGSNPPTCLAPNLRRKQRSQQLPGAGGRAPALQGWSAGLQLQPPRGAQAEIGPERGLSFAWGYPVFQGGVKGKSTGKTEAWRSRKKENRVK